MSGLVKMSILSTKRLVPNWSIDAQQTNPSSGLNARTSCY